MMVLRLQDHFPQRITDWLISGILVTWGMACLAAPAEVWDQPINGMLAKIATQGQIGSFAMVLGIVRLGALFVNGAVQRTPHLRALGAFLSLFLWVQITLGMSYGGLPSISAIFYPWLLMADVYNVYRASRDAKFSDLRARALHGAPDARGA